MRLILSLICSAAVLTISGCGGSSEPTDARTLVKCYATEFGTAPPSGVRNLKAKQVVVGDAGGAWLRFEADSNVVSQIISNRFTASSWTDFSIYGHLEGGNTPKWWQPLPDTLDVFYVNEKWRPGPNYSIAVLAYDATNRLVYFYHGISF
jgi:hypothetical protein